VSTRFASVSAAITSGQALAALSEKKRIKRSCVGSKLPSMHPANRIRRPAGHTICTRLWPSDRARGID
jgi:hypothetical protein